METKLLNVVELAKLLNVSSMWVYEKVKAGKIPCIRLGRTIRFVPEDIDSFISSNKKEGL